jgi:nucleoside-diphosphate-sugar epimerase
MDVTLITGGAGFIGSHLCDYMISKGYRVICLDNLLTGSKKNIEHLLSNPNFELIEHDVISPFDDSIMHKFNSVSSVFHLASPASPIDYQNYSEETLMVNSMGTMNILAFSRKLGARVLIASTSEVYGDPLEHPQKETYHGNVNTFGPRSCYDESKRFAEAATYVYLNKYKINARIIRIFNTYGPRMKKDDGRVVSNFINAALVNEKINIDGDGSQTRSFCYVSDLVEGIFKAMFTDSTSGEIFNLGNPEEYTIRNLATKIADLTGSHSEIHFSNAFRTDDPMKRKPDITKAKGVLVWEPRVGLDEGLQKTIEYYKNN